MIRIFNIYDQICATCEYWIEKDKNIGFQSKQMFIEYGHVQGKCLSENNTLRNPHGNHHKKENNTVDDTESPGAHIAFTIAEGVVIGNDHQAAAGIQQTGGQPYHADTAQNRAADFVDTAAEADDAATTHEMHHHPDQPNHLCCYDGKPGPYHPPIQYVYKEVGTANVNHQRDKQTYHGLPGIAACAHEVVQIHECTGYRKAQHQHQHEIVRRLHGLPGDAEEAQQRLQCHHG